MPCYQVNLISVSFKAENLDLLRKAAAAMKLSYNHTGNAVTVGGMVIDTARQTITGSSQSVINALKREYSRQTIEQATRQNSWILSQQSATAYQAAKY